MEETNSKHEIPPHRWMLVLAGVGEIHVILGFIALELGIALGWQAVEVGVVIVAASPLIPGLAAVRRRWR